MILSRVKQVYTYLFCKYDEKNSLLVREILNSEEFEIFNKMSRYEKIHSFNLLKLILNNEILKNNKDYQKLALLHDCGKKNFSLFKRIKKVLVGDKELENHPNLSYEKLKNINLNVGILAKHHHDKYYDENMKIFQQLDDK